MSAGGRGRNDIQSIYMHYGYKREVSGAFPEAVERTKLSLAKEGFGILTEIDVQATLKKKLDVEFGRYVILGACNPPFAYQALQSERDIGLLLPCNIVVYEDEGKVYATAILPTVALAAVGNTVVADIAKQVEAKLKTAIDSI